MSSYKSYPAYQESGLDVLGPVPDHWDKVLLNYFFKENKEKNKGNIESHVLSLSYGKVISKKGKENFGLIPESFETYQIINQDYLVFRFTDLQNDHKSLRVGYAEFRGIITSAYLGLKAQSEKVLPKYYYYLFHSLDIKKYFYGFGGGVRLSLDWSTLSKIKYPLPPKPEQTAIAQFLDRKTAEIKAFIELKEKTIALLKERKTAIINQAVTKGLDPNVEMKDSGIEWLGEIPKHWEVKKLKYISKINPSKSSSRFSKNSDQKVVFLPMERVSENGEISNEIKRPIKEVWEGFTYFEKYDVLLAKITPCFENGKGAYLNDLDSEVGFGTTEFHVFRPNLNIVLADFFYNIIQSEMFMTLGEENMVGSAGQKRVPNSFISNFEAAFPSIKEQNEIVEYIDRTNSEIDQSITQAKKEIALIKEYQQSLISDAVTGKIDVRGEVEKDYQNKEPAMSMAAEDSSTYSKHS